MSRGYLIETSHTLARYIIYISCTCTDKLLIVNCRRNTRTNGHDIYIYIYTYIDMYIDMHTQPINIPLQKVRLH